MSELFQIVGAYYEDALNNHKKVEVVSKHLQKINPNATINSYDNDIYDTEVEKVVAQSDFNYGYR